MTFLLEADFESLLKRVETVIFENLVKISSSIRFPESSSSCGESPMEVDDTDGEIGTHAVAAEAGGHFPPTEIQKNPILPMLISHSFSYISHNANVPSLPPLLYTCTYF